jgi:hypothetical protein
MYKQLSHRKTCHCPTLASTSASPRCRAILKHSQFNWRADYTGPVVLEDGSFSWHDANVGADKFGEYLRLEVRRPLRKTPLNGSPVKQSKCFAILRRTQRRFDWESDFAGWLLLEDGRLYRIGSYVFSDHLELYLRPQLQAAKLELVR